MLRWVGAVAGDLGRGFVAGTGGTAAMTASSTIEMRLRNRPSSDAPLRAAEEVLGVEPRSDTDAARLGTMVHWAYGAGWGAVRGLISAMRIPEPLATIAHFSFVWGTALFVLPRLGVMKPPAEWGRREIAIDAAHHAVYAIGTARAWKSLGGRT